MEQNENELFRDENSVFKYNLNKATKDRDGVKIVEDLVRLILLKNYGKNEATLKLVEVYNLFGIEGFVDLIDIMNGKTVPFPSIEEMKDVVKIAVSYYYKYLKGKSWEEIKEILQDEDCSSIKYGINCSKLNRFITELMDYQEFREKQGETFDD